MWLSLDQGTGGNDDDDNNDNDNDDNNGGIDENFFMFGGSDNNRVGNVEIKHDGNEIRDMFEVHEKISADITMDETEPMRIRINEGQIKYLDKEDNTSENVEKDSHTVHTVGETDRQKDKDIVEVDEKGLEVKDIVEVDEKGLEVKESAKPSETDVETIFDVHEGDGKDSEAQPSPAIKQKTPTKHSRRFETDEEKKARKAWSERGLIVNKGDKFQRKSANYIKLLVKALQKRKDKLLNLTQQATFRRLTTTKSFSLDKKVKDHPDLKYLHLKSVDNDVATAIEEYLKTAYDSSVVMVNI